MAPRHHQRDNVLDGIEVDFDLLKSFSMVNLDLARDPAILDSIAQAIDRAPESEATDLLASFKDKRNLENQADASAAGVRSILREMGLHRA